MVQMEDPESDSGAIRRSHGFAPRASTGKNESSWPPSQDRTGRAIEPDEQGRFDCTGGITGRIDVNGLLSGLNGASCGDGG